MGVPYDLEPSALKWSHNGNQVAFGYSKKNGSFQLKLIKQLADGTWSLLYNPVDTRDNSLFLSVSYSGMVGPGSLDPDGKNDPMPAESMGIIEFFNKHAPDVILSAYEDEITELLAADLGAPAVGSPPPTTFRFPDEVFACFDQALAKRQVVGGAVRKAA